MKLVHLNLAVEYAQEKGSNDFDDCSIYVTGMHRFSWRRRSKAKTNSHLPSPESLSGATGSKIASEVETTQLGLVTSSQPEDLWDRVYHSLREDKSTRKLLDSYERVLFSELGAKPRDGNIGELEKREDLSALINKRLQEIDKARWKFTLGSQTIELKAQVDRIVKAVLFAKDAVSSALISEPHVALAWAGVCVILPLVLNPSGQQKALIGGLDRITDIICRYAVIEDVYQQQRSCIVDSPRPTSSAHISKALDSLEKNVFKLYSKILHFQAQVVCQLFRPTVLRYGRDILKLDDWSTLLLEIQEADVTCRSFLSILDSDKLQHGLSEQSRRIETLHAALEVNLDQLKYTAEEDAKTIKDRRRLDEESACLRALYTSDYATHKARNPDRVPGTCKWFLKHHKFEEWLSNQSSDLLWVTADPGCGKSVLSKSLIQGELCSDQSRTTCFYFFKSDSDEQRDVTTALCGLLHQLFSQKSVLLDQAVKELQKAGDRYFHSYHNVWDLLIASARDHRAGETVCIIDALDECEGNGKKMLVESLNAFYSSEERHSARLKFLVTSRPYFNIRQSCDHRTIRLAGEDESESIKEEIDLVIKHSLREMGSSLRLSSETQDLLQSRLLSIGNRTYLWLHLTISHIKQSLGVNTPQKMSKVIDETPHTIYDAYETILDKSPFPEEARRLLHIVVAAVRPLTLVEMNMAFNLNSERRPMTREEVDLDPLDTFPNYIKDVCGLFVTIADSKVYLLHETAKEFLVSRDDSVHLSTRNALCPKNWGHSFATSESHLILTKVCLSYLSFATFDERPLSVEGIDYWEFTPARRQFVSALQEHTAKHEFLDYASRHWATHFRLASVEQDLVDLWFHVCDPKSRRFFTWFGVYWNSHGIRDAYGKLTPIPGTPSTIMLASGKLTPTPGTLNTLMLASGFGKIDVVQRVIGDGLPDMAGDSEWAPLLWATRSENQAVAELLLNRGVQPDIQDFLGFTPLTLSSISGNDEMVRLLIDNGATIDCSDGLGQTPLMHAARERKGDTLKLLLEHGAQPETRDKTGWTPLEWAASKGFAEIVKLLVEGGANPQSENTYGRTPLANAVQDGHAGVVAYLLQHGSQPRLADSDGNLLHVAISGWEKNLELMELLLDKGGIDPDGLSTYDLTPIEYAINHWRNEGREDRVQLLLFKGADPNLTGPAGIPPTIRAAKNGQHLIVKLLLQYGADPDIMDCKGRTPLRRARRTHRYCKNRSCGHEAVIGLLEPIVTSKDQYEDVDEGESDSDDFEISSSEDEDEGSVDLLEDGGQKEDIGENEEERPNTVGDLLIGDGESSRKNPEDVEGGYVIRREGSEIVVEVC